MPIPPVTLFENGNFKIVTSPVYVKMSALPDFNGSVIPMSKPNSRFT